MSDVVRHILVCGRVQGVGYRAWVEGEASARNLEGWVRNRKDGSVEAVFAGPEDAVEAMIAKCHYGPGTARVDRIDDKIDGRDTLHARHPGERFSVLSTI
jgi:acylphosphatase